MLAKKIAEAFGSYEAWEKDFNWQAVEARLK